MRSVVAAGLLAATAGAAAASQRKPPSRPVPTRTAESVLALAGAAPRAIVSVDGIRFGRADASGAMKIATITPGKHTVSVSQLGYAPFSQAAVFVAGRVTTITPKKTPITDEAELARQRGEDLWLDGKHALAVDQFKAAIAARGGAFPEARIGLARALYGMKHFEAAIALLSEMIAADAKNVEAHTVLANVLRERGLYEDAIAEYRKAITLAPSKSPEAHAGLAIVLEDRGDLPAAADEFRAAIAQNEDAEPILYQLLGSVLERLERRPEAIEAYERFLALAPDNALAPAVHSVLDQLREERDAGDVNPYAPH